jgi:hypothetical protein
MSVREQQQKRTELRKLLDLMVAVRREVLIASRAE